MKEYLFTHPLYFGQKTLLNIIFHEMLFHEKLFHPLEKHFPWFDNFLHKATMESF